jgi:hypothetical protein
MSRKSRDTNATNAPAGNLEVQRIRVNRDGYDSDGAYWGAGPDVFVVTTAGGTEEITVRAKSAAEARQLATQQLEASEIATAPKAETRIGGTPTRKSRFEIDWQDPVTNASVRVRITHSRNYLVDGTDHVEVESIAPKRAPLPITETGYLSNFIDALELINAGGPVTWIKSWLDREAGGKAWRTRQQARQQGDLFQWADARAEVAPRREGKPSKPGAKRRPPTRKDRSPE